MLTLELTGITGWAADLMDRIGAWGVGLFTLLETVFPPIPSEVILPLAGFLSQQGRMNIIAAIIASTLGAYLGALLLYSLGAAVGLDRSVRILAKLPLVDRQDFDRGTKWFSRHGRASIFFGRLIPGVRSVISLPAGAQRMNLAVFSASTIAGSGLWNTLLITLGAALGTQYELVDRYSVYLNYAVYAAIAGLLVWLIARRIRQRTGQQQNGSDR
ncbi:membrane protein DedA, SNARE-associated domain [Friedmanniella luteola]|uniref:Membrane protein DedA, SNARE-associated domain n=1 Tax=Friedmanniella luteola TaxID=546871 RepID=A0A1H1WRB9_9ACTN|nr:DedA family protein [Friedmanniella luteola]SDS98876.1 membrane protein DedA, SNARE-associated domain [Friedmanniella luteola]